MQTQACDFCGTEIEPGTGTMFVFVDGRVDHYCSSKCEKNADLGRVPREVEWTEEGQRLRDRRQRTLGTQDELEEVAADTPEEAGGPAEEVDTVPEESEAQAVAAATSDPGADEETATGTADERVDAATGSDAEARTTDAETGELDEVEGRRAGGDDPDIEEDIQHEDSNVERRDPDPAEAAASTEDGARETDADSDTDFDFDAEDVERTGEETVSQEEADEVVIEEDTDEDHDREDERSGEEQ
jgi:large subunit ribosomal protein L24e